MAHKGWMAVVAMTVLAVMVVTDAEARRVGGGRNFGAQRNATPPAASAPTAPSTAPATPGAAANPVMPAKPGATAPSTAAAPAAAAAAAPARSGMSRWLGPIAGIAAGLGLAALMSHLGLSEAFGSFLLMALLVIGVVFLVRFLFMRRSNPPMAYAGRTPASTSSYPGGAPRSETAWGQPPRVEPVLRPEPSASSGRFPPGFDRTGFEREARAQFGRVQAAWDAADRRALADVMTPELFEEVSRDLASRGTHLPTEIVHVDAQVLEAVTEGDKHWASVRFTGLLREDGGATPKQVDETWNLAKPVDGSSGWLLAGIQQNEAATAH